MTAVAPTVPLVASVALAAVPVVPVVLEALAAPVALVVALAAPVALVVALAAPVVGRRYVPTTMITFPLIVLFATFELDTTILNALLWRNAWEGACLRDGGHVYGR